MNLANLATVYNNGCGERMAYLNAAEALSRLTLQEVSPTGHQFSSYSNPYSASGGTATNLYNPAGTQAVTTVSSTLLNLLFPLNSNWFQVQFLQSPPEDSRIAATEALAQLERNMLNSMLRHNYNAAMLDLLQNIIIEGQGILHKLPDGKGLRPIQLRNFVAKWYYGRPYSVCIKEEVPKMGDGEKMEFTTLYTYVEYDEGKVFQQVGDTGEVRHIPALKPTDYILAVTSIPRCGHYSYGFAYRYYPLMNQINELSKSMSQAIAIAAKSVMVVDPDSGLSMDQLERVQPGQMIAGLVNGGVVDKLGWLSARSQIGEWQWVANHIGNLMMELAKAFALGLAQNPALNKDRQTAESVRQITSELQAQAGSITQVLQTSLQLPFAKSYLETELEATANSDALSLVQPVVTSGASALSRLYELNKLFELVDMFSRNPVLAQQFAGTINAPALFIHAAKVLGLPIQDFIVQQQPQMQPGMMPQPGMPQQMGA